MASPPPPLTTTTTTTTTFLFSLLLLISISPSQAANKTQTHLHFYFHDVVVGTASAGKTSVVRVTQPVKSSATMFGMTTIMDDPLTEGPEPTSTAVGKAQGIYAAASQDELAFLMVMNLVFTGGTYNGSSLSVVGRNPVMNDVREMPVVGGTGVFRSARGYCLAHTVKLDGSTGNAVVEYNVYVTH